MTWRATTASCWLLLWYRYTSGIKERVIKRGRETRTDAYSGGADGPKVEYRKQSDQIVTIDRHYKATTLVRFLPSSSFSTSTWIHPRSTRETADDWRAGNKLVLGSSPNGCSTRSVNLWRLYTATISAASLTKKILLSQGDRTRYNGCWRRIYLHMSSSRSVLRAAPAHQTLNGLKPNQKKSLKSWSTHTGQGV